MPPLSSLTDARLPSLNRRQTIIIGFGFFGISLIGPIFNTYVPLFLQAGNPDFEAQLLAAGRDIPAIAGFGLSPALAFFIMTWDNILNVFIQPWVGARSDRTWNRFGRRKGWILAGVPLTIVGFTLLPFAQTAVALAAFILITNLGLAIFRSPAVAWLGDLFPAAQRSQANGIINLMGGIGALIAFVGGGVLFDTAGRAAPFIAAAVLLIVAVTVIITRVREPRHIAANPAPDEGVWQLLRRIGTAPDRRVLIILVTILLFSMAFNALDTGLSSFAVFSLGIAPGQTAIVVGSFAIAFILFAVPAGFIGNRLGRHRALQIGLVGFAAVLAVGYAVIDDTATFLAILIPAGLFWAIINVNALPLLYDYGHEGQIGAYTGLYYFATQSAAIAGPTLGGFIVDALDDNFRWLFLLSTLILLPAALLVSRVAAPAATAVTTPSEAHP